MALTLELTEDQERQILESAERHDEAMVREVLLEALDNVVAKVLRRAEERQAADTVADVLSRRALPVGSLRSKEEIDRFLLAERASWD